MRWVSIAALVLALPLVAACAEPTVASLPRPTLVARVQTASGQCEELYAVDPDGRLYLEVGCGDTSTGLSERVVLDEGVRTEVEGDFEAIFALPPDGDCGSPIWSGDRYRFYRTESGVAGPDWTSVEQCEPGVSPAAIALFERLITLAD